jgi:RES domain-containing protein
MLAFRMHGSRYNVFDPSGALLRDGRWHSAGTPVIYAAEHISLAVLETLIHAGGRRIPPRVITQINIPDTLRIESASWMDTPASQSFGDAWVAEQRSPVLRVPSIGVNQMESNFLFNPHHPDFSKVTHAKTRPFAFDPRFILFR